MTYQEQEQSGKFVAWGKKKAKVRLRLGHVDQWLSLILLGILLLFIMARIFVMYMLLRKWWDIGWENFLQPDSLKDIQLRNRVRE